MTLGILFETSDHEVKYYNYGFLSIWNLKESDIEETPHISLIELMKKSKTTCEKNNFLPGNQSKDQSELLLSDGRIVIQTHLFVEKGEAGNGHLWIYEDVTLERQLQSELKHLANFDSLTDLHNRNYYNSEIEKMAAYADRHNRMLAMLYFDIDEFKIINDTYGHPEGDQVLIRIAHELKNLIRKEEVLCRIGGDEFVVLLIIRDRQEAEQLAKRIIDKLAQIRHSIHNEIICLTASLGIAIYPNPSITPDLLATHSDIAMYQAKKKGKNTYHIYEANPKELEVEKERLSWKDKIEYALDHDYFELHFQGIYSANNQELSHLEALIRMKDMDKDGVLIYPDRFIPVAEKTGQIILIDRWVIQHATKLLAQHPEIPSIAINLSGKSFDDITLPEYIRQSIYTNEIDPARLLIELTETETVQDIHDAEDFILALQKIGCSVCLDDFGTGFASFSYLKHLPVDVLKIDGTFIKNIENSYENRLFVQSMVMVAKGLGKKTVAEFVENEYALEACKSLGIDMLQGYHLSKPTKEFDL